MALPGMMDQPTMETTIYSMDTLTPPSQTQMIINQQQDMFSWRQKELPHGNQRNKQLSQCLRQNPNTLHSQKQDGKLSGLEIYMTNLDFRRWDRQSSRAIMKVQ